MSPDIKRYGPYAGAVVALVVGVYFIGGKRLTGEAGLHDSTISHLGTPKPELHDKLEELVRHPVLPRVQGGQRPEATAIQADIESLGHEALASVMTHFQDNGCVQPGSVAELEIIERLLDDDKITSLERRVIAYILIDAAAHASKDLELTSADAEPFSVHPVVAKVATQIGDGNLTQIPEVELKPGDPLIAFDCSMEALRISSTILKTGVIDATALHHKALDAAHALPLQHPATPSFVKVAALAANASKQPAATFMGLINDDKLGDAARGVACDEALQAGVPATEISKAVDKTSPVELQMCLVRAGDGPAIVAALDSPNRELRIQAITRHGVEGDPAKIKKVLATSDQSGLSPRERFALLSAVTQAVIASDDPETLLKPAEDLAEANPESHVPLELAQIIYRTNAKQPEIQTIEEGEEEPPLAASLAALSNAEQTVTLPTSIAGGFKAEVDDGNTLQVKDLEISRHGLCDRVTQPGAAQAVIDQAVEDLDEGIVCIGAGNYTGPLELTKGGIRYVAIGTVVLDKSIVIKAPVTLVGIEAHGPIVVSAGARGTMIIGSALDGGGISETSQIALSYNALPEGKLFRVPGGHIVAEADEPPSAWWTYVPDQENVVTHALLPRWPPVL